MFALSCLSMAFAVTGAFAVENLSQDFSTSLESILAQAHQGPLYTYPTSLTQGIVPKGIHSHNDYWRPLPFYTALSQGVISVEADVWLYNGTLHVGHEEGALTASRTFESLYINPILDVLRRQNPLNSSFLSAPTYNGVFDTSASQTLYLFVDVKTDGASTWPVVVKALEPLRQAGFLSSTNGTAFTSGAVTVIGTGNTPLNLVQPIESRDYFWDAVSYTFVSFRLSTLQLKTTIPLVVNSLRAFQLSKANDRQPIPTLNSTFSNITSLVSPIASTDFAAQFGSVLGNTFNSTQLALLRAQIATAHSKGIKVRYWDQPNWPLSTRNGLWKTLWAEGADLLNADDVVAAAELGKSEL
ncbi:hypothetical protein BP5796_06014 [Coleophoma crateriformis]|uniref:Altered inheritance of mitochondria protein 6 n=1 Tax=Coleophoma crateriformis TaxID=565419 RepID=A0A3D8RVR8_9HELO|nr:hypothetical protein BP5796_06014 [Coleophoma crateriformis]